MTKKGWKGEKQRHSLAKKGIRTTKSNIKKVDLQTKWYQVLQYSGEKIDMHEMYHEDLGVMYSFPSDLPGTIDLSINIQNPLVKLYGEEYLDNLSNEELDKLVKKTNEFFAKYYPEMSYDYSHVKYESWITFNVSMDLSKEQINELNEIPVDKINEKIGKHIENFYIKSGMYKFATDWNMFYDGINNYKQFMKGD